MDNSFFAVDTSFYSTEILKVRRLLILLTQIELHAYMYTVKLEATRKFPI